MILPLDTELTESSELERRPSAADSFEVRVGTEFLLVSFVLLEEEEEDADEGDLLSWAWLQEGSLEESVCSCLKSLWISTSERAAFCSLASVACTSSL